jgi:signal transduction histidine kinase/CheY-like chemotaxis protein/HAMP domain-containing protein
MTEEERKLTDLDQVELLKVLIAFRNGDFSVRMPCDRVGMAGNLADTLNEILEMESRILSELELVARAVGKEGTTDQRMPMPRFSGGWSERIDFINALVSDLVQPMNEMARVIGSVARGDLTQKVSDERVGRALKGDFLRTSREVNDMVGQLSRFASEVTRVAREVGTEGKLGGQAQVPGAAGVWGDLTENVNQLAGNLTSQVRAIAEVATAVTAGDLSRSVTVEAAGEVAVLKDKINEMIRNLRETTIRSTEQDWLKTNLAKFTRMLQGQRDLLAVANQVLSELAPLVGAHQGVFYLAKGDAEDFGLYLLASYAFQNRRTPANVIRLGQGLVGQAALERVRILVTDLPPDYLQIDSGLGRGAPANLVVLPVLFEGTVNAVLELASFSRFSPVHLAFLEQLTESIGIVLNTISSSMRKEELLKQSQALTEKLQAQQEEMTKTNRSLEAQTATLRRSQLLLEAQQEELKQRYQDLAERTRLVENQKSEVEAARAAIEIRAERQQLDLKVAGSALEERAKLVREQQAEVESSRAALHEKAEQLTQASRYKAEFLANMSHDLRTPLNSLLILSRTLEENADNNLTTRQVEFASTIHAAGQDLLELIDNVLDLSRIENGAMELEWTDISFHTLVLFAERTFRPMAEGKGLRFEVRLDPALPRHLHTDWLRLQQVIRNLLSNAFKFTETGSVVLEVATARSGWSRGHPALDAAPQVLAFSVQDTGIGIDPAKHEVVFEAFQQADGTTSRMYGGTGLGLSISRGIASLFGGEITLCSAPGQGSTFTLFLPGHSDRGSPEPPVLLESNGPVTQEVLDEAFRVVRSITQHGPRRLLLVEDDSVQRLALRQILEAPGLELVEAGTGREALAALRGTGFDCMVLDLNLPDMTGMELLRGLRQEYGRVGLPVIIHTARTLTARERLEFHRMAEAVVIKEPRSPARVFDETALFLGRPDLPAPDLGPDATGPAAAERDSLRGRRVLLVDDDARNIFALRSVLENQGMAIVPAASGQEALAYLGGHPDTDLVLLDVMLPGMDGLETARRLRADERFQNLPVIALTAKAMKGDRERCLEAGASDYIPKPVDLGRLLAAMRHQLEPRCW